MTPHRQKAQEIFDKFNQIVMFNLYLIVDVKTKLSQKEIKNYVKCQAVIAVQEMIDEYNRYQDLNTRLVLCGTEQCDSVVDRLIFWNEVKNEIGKL